MTKNELIEKLQNVEGNPLVLLDDAEFGLISLRDVGIVEAHQSKDNPEEYVNHSDFHSEEWRRMENAYYHNNYKEERKNCILLF